MPTTPLCWKAGSQWKGQPKGKESTLSANKVYVAGDVDSKVAILFVHDALGWTSHNARLLADHFAEQLNAAVYLPDFFASEVIPTEVMDDAEAREKWGLRSFVERNSKAKRWPEIEACAKELRKSYTKLGAVGYCYGGWAVFQLGARSNPLVDAIVAAHPTMLTKDEIEGVGVPVQIIAPEHDVAFSPELKAFANEKIPALDVEYDYQYFPGALHAFCTRSDEEDPRQKRALERSKAAVVYWFRHQLS